MSLIIRSLSYQHTDKSLLFKNVDLVVHTGQKAALVGDNGSGKSTLLQVIAGKLSPTSGNISCNETTWYIPQHLGQFDNLTVAQALQIDKKLYAMQRILNGDTEVRYFNDLNDDWEIEQKLQVELQKWRLNYLTADTLMQNLSGGQKTKIFLTGIAIHEPQMILMDEPSNHLDVASRNQLYELINSCKATVLAVSHDRTLLNLLPETFELSKSGIALYGGNFDFYRQQKEENLQALEGQLDERTKTLKQSQQKARDMAVQRQKKESRGKAAGQTNSLPRIIAGGLKSKAEQSTARVMDAQSEKVAGVATSVQELRSQLQHYQTLKIDLNASALHLGKILVDGTAVSYSYEQDSLWQPITFQIRSGDRIRIEGDNGAGKTTLLKMITGILEPAAGKLQRAPFSYLYLDQDYSLIDPAISVYEQAQHYNSRNLQEHELKSLLIYAQFPREKFDGKCAALSGGEKMKLALCCLSVSNQAPDVLILDEPTNNLDIPSLEVLTGAIKHFSGTLLVISHDQYFVEEVGTDKCIIVNKSTLNAC